MLIIMIKLMIMMMMVVVITVMILTLCSTNHVPQTVLIAFMYLLMVRRKLW